MSNQTRAALLLRIVALLFLFEGLCAVAAMVVRFAQGSPLFDLRVLGILTCLGLMSHSKGWRTWALFCLWCGMLAAPVMVLLNMLNHSRAFLSICGIRMSSLSPVAGSALAIAVFLLEFGQYRVLTRPDVRALFAGKPVARAAH